MKALILAAGRGSRMKGLTDERPKCLVTVRGVALLDRQVSALREAGITEIGIVSGYRREMLADRGLVEFHNPRWAETNMVSSLACAKEWLNKGPTIVSYSDIFYASSAPAALAASDVDLAVTYDPHWLDLWSKRFADPLEDAETFRTGPGGTIVEIGAKPKAVADVEGQYMGLLRFTPRAWTEVERLRDGMPLERCDRMHMTGTLQCVIEAGRVPVHAVAYEGEWGEVDSEGDLASYGGA
ncbi:MAG TPA: phosphocholine cytidylyltransferase family protein [Prosthecobacter sp.]|nr:phosphocholine cytidylyltransferase family protein [Prosthecobacter sp.]